MYRNRSCRQKLRHTLGMSTQFLKINLRDLLSQLRVRGKQIFYSLVRRF